VLITGGSSGIGLACAHRLTADGHRVALLARSHEGLSRVSGDLHPEPAVVVADVTDAERLEAAVEEAADALGGLDTVVANAGAAAYGPFVEMKREDIHRTLDITLVGMINTVHAALPHLERTKGTLVVMGSVAGRAPTPWLSVYAAAKHGVRGFVRSLRAELPALGIPVQIALVAPGPVDTPFWRRARTTDGRLPPRLFGTYTPEDVAAEVARALQKPRHERTVGGLMAAWVSLDGAAPGLTLWLTERFAKVGWRKRKKRPETTADALSQPVEEPAMEEGLSSRPSALRRLRDWAG
jgi:NADP-dependent 3-hydroxy acid dehydrogenase YdfG